MANFFADTAFVVFDGLGNAKPGKVQIIDIGPPPLNRFLRVVAGSIKMLKCHHVSTADLVHFHDPELLLAGFFLKLSGKKVVYDAHEDVPRQIANKHWIPPTLRGVIARLVEGVETFVTKRLDAVVAATPLIAERYRKINPNTTLVRNFPLLHEFLQVPLERPRSNTICYVGVLTRERGIIELLDALVLLDDVTLVACGPFQSNEFAAELQRHPGWQHVCYLGVVGREKVVDVLARSQIGLVTLLATPNQIESLPVKLFEYMAAGLPFLASDFPLWVQIARDSGGGEWVSPDNPEEIAVSLRRMLDDPQRLQEMGEAGRIAAQRLYNWAPEGQALTQLYQQLLAEPLEEIKHD